MRIDTKDKKIIYELDKDSRQTNKQIARMVGTSEQVVGNRIKRLQKQGIIEYFFVRTNPSVAGYMHIKIYLRLHNITKSKEEELITGLNEQKNVCWLSSLMGKYDLVISIYVKNIAELTKKYEDLFGRWREYILVRNIVILERAFTYTKAYLLPKQKSQPTIYTRGDESKFQEDSEYHKILKILNVDGRKSLVDIAKQVNVSADTIRYRLTNLKKNGMITGFGVKINYSKLNHFYYIICLKVQNMNQQKYKRLEQFSELNNNIIVFMQTIGDHDFELEVEITNRNELTTLMKRLRDYFMFEIKDYEILEVIREHRISYYPF